MPENRLIVVTMTMPEAYAMKDAANVLYFAAHDPAQLMAYLDRGQEEADHAANVADRIDAMLRRTHNWRTVEDLLGE